MQSSHPPLADADHDQPAPATDVLTLLAADHTQAILRHIHDAPAPARELAEACEASRTTVYRRLNRLADVGLVESRMAYDPDGHHRTVFETTVESLTLDVTDDGYAISVDADRSDADAGPVPQPQPGD
ncbi:winged helix-turn-helix domain-containing protein [Halorubellus sp. PRR65]|uniref:ArsR/SmtB family transcription factor n=1 Tax=Halorubellus sp. PRR65 TaxID=3098148 RepID=UPI002B262582|nr:winged helix-turn-helix domain-containing protein [Halorubellus sp. PRR65]